MKKSIVISTVTAGVLTLLAIGCSPDQKRSNDAAAVPVLVAQSVITNVPVQVQPPPVGHVAPYSTVTVHSQIQGVISAVHFQEGQEVKKGDLLFTLDPRPEQAALAQAQANLARDRAQLENAKIQFDREQKLFDQKLVSQDDYDTSKAGMDALQGTVQADEAAITNAEINLGYTEIRAPINGVAGSLQAYAGNVVKAPDDTLLTINQIHPIYVAFAVPEQYLPEIRKEMRHHTLAVEAAYQGMNVPTPKGELTFVNNTVDESTGTILLKATFSNQNDALWPGQYVNVLLTLSDLTNIVVVPSQAVQTGQSGEYIYVVQSDKTVAVRPVTVGITYHDQTVVEKGLKPGETIVIDGQLRLAPGTKVAIKTAEQTGLAISSAAAP